MSRERRRRAGGTGLRPLEPLEARDLLALVLAPFSFVANQPFAGQVASFETADLPGGVTDFSANVTWGDGTTTPAAVTAAGGGYDVLASKTYSAAGPVVVSVQVTGKDDAKLSAATVATVAPPASLVLVSPLGLTATAGSPFTGSIGVVAGGTTDAVPTDFTSVIDWGDGSPPTPGQTTLSTPPATTGPATTPTLVLIGTHTYAHAGSYPVSAVVTRTATGQTAHSNVELSAFGFGGGLDPLSGGVVRGGVVVTDQQRPLISGQAEPRSTVTVWFRRTLAGDPVFLGQTQADDAGRWGLVIGPVAGLPIYLYGTSQPVNGPPTPTTLLNEGRTLYVTPRPVSVHHVTRGPVANEVRLTVPRPSPGGYDPAGLMRADSYRAIDGGGRGHTPVSVRSNARGRARSRPVALVFAPGTLPEGPMTLQVSHAGLAGSDAPGVFRVTGRRR